MYFCFGRAHGQASSDCLATKSRRGWKWLDVATAPSYRRLACRFFVWKSYRFVLGMSRRRECAAITGECVTWIFSVNIEWRQGKHKQWDLRPCKVGSAPNFGLSLYLLQERIIAEEYIGPDGKGERFKATLFIVMCNRLVTCAVALSLLISSELSLKPQAPLWNYAAVSGAPAANALLPRHGWKV